MDKWAAPKRLRGAGILGMNRRNVGYIDRYNDRRHYPLVDNKLSTKLIAAEVGLAVPRLIRMVEAQHEIESLDDELDGLSEFAAKPAHGSAGKGILVVAGRSEGDFVKPNGVRVTLPELKRHLTNIISGLHSLGGRTDVAFLEELVKVNPALDAYSYEGVPDIRFIVFRGFPIMSMLRLSTKASDGKANLHQGAIGVGLDIASGKAIQAVQNDRLVERHPDTGADLSEIAIADWDELLALATNCYEATSLGYLGCDIVIDRTRGPLLLEMNARPGLSIQIANNAGLLPRLEMIEAMNVRRMSSAERVDFAREQFGVTSDTLSKTLKNR